MISAILPARPITAPISSPNVMAMPYPAVWINQLGTQTRFDATGKLWLNGQLIEALTSYRQAVLPPLARFLENQLNQPVLNVPAVCEALYLAQRLAEEKTPGINGLYGITSRLNNHPHPLVQIYLAGFYRHLDEPATFGPLLATLLNHAVMHYSEPMSAWDPTEEVGGAILQKIAEKTADVLRKRVVGQFEK